ncbi:hypothetical protein ACJW31_06G010500 [Castanea mollissima]
MHNPSRDYMRQFLPILKDKSKVHNWKRLSKAKAMEAPMVRDDSVSFCFRVQHVQVILCKILPVAIACCLSEEAEKQLLELKHLNGLSLDWILEWLITLLLLQCLLGMY